MITSQYIDLMSKFRVIKSSGSVHYSGRVDLDINVELVALEIKSDSLTSVDISFDKVQYIFLKLRRLSSRQVWSRSYQLLRASLEL